MDMEFLMHLKRPQRTSYLTKAKMVNIKMYKSFIANIYFKNLPLTPDTIKQLKSYKKKIEQICQKSSSLKTVRSLLIDKDFFVKFLRIVLPVIQPMVYKSKVNKKKKTEVPKEEKKGEKKKKSQKEEKKGEKKGENEILTLNNKNEIPAVCCDVVSYNLIYFSIFTPQRPG